MPRLSKIGAAALAAFGWTGLSTVSASYLVVAGGGGGGSNSSAGGGGGGGAGGYRTGTASLNPTLSYTITVGAGGAGSASGSDSTFNAITSTGGGYGGTNASVNGASGGSGGGGAYNTPAGTGGSGNTPSTSPSQGNNGGNGNGSVGSGAGGGGASAAAANVPTGSSGTAGGAGTANSISGSSVTYAGGGGGGSDTTGASGGAGGGGAGAGGTNGNGTAGTANLGGGGGGSARNGTGGTGGSGVVIISYPAPQKFGGGIVTTSGSNVIHTFNTSGTLTPLSSLTASYLIVAGGAGGAYARGGGGGAGGLLSGSSLTIDTNSNYLVTVGAGGTGGTSGTPTGANGTNSAFTMVTTTAIGGGGGGTPSGTGVGVAGGSGGGGGSDATSGYAGGSGTSGQGYAGGQGNPLQTVFYGAGGGGGAGAVGSAGTALVGGNGGVGVASSISGLSTYYAGGGGGGIQSGGTAGSGGNGGGGAGGAGSTAGTSGTTNLGAGGGGGGGTAGNGGNGGSGVVIISYAGSTQQMAGGTVTISGGNVIHTFTSSGYLTPIKYVNNSLRFRSSASAYLSRTPATAGNVTTWTWSAWVKRGILGAEQSLLSAGPSSRDNITFTSDDKLWIYFYNTSNGQLKTTQLFRDPAAWYHLVVAIDLTQATASNRIKVYVNGVQVTAFDTASYPSQNYSSGYIGSNVLQAIGKDVQASAYLDGYQAEVNYVNGQQLTPNSFGTFNSYGVWQPITYGGSYGTNGFYLPFTNKTSTTTLGYDFSPNGNNWTTNNISLTAGSTYDSMTDVPTLTSATAANYAVMNPLNTYSSITVSNANLTLTLTEAAYRKSVATMAFPASGKCYVEGNTSGGTDYFSFGIVTPDAPLSDAVGNTATGYGVITSTVNWDKKNNGTTTGNFWTTTSLPSSATLQIAVDTTNGKLWIGYNNVWLDGSGGLTGNPSAGTNATFTIDTTRTYLASFGGYKSNSIIVNPNFGQQPFTYTPPTGYVALNTYNL